MLKLVSNCLVLGFIILVLGCTGQPNPMTGESIPLVDTLQQFHLRGGLSNVFWKINNTRQIRIAYIGGSITQAGDGWRDLTYNWFRTTYPHQVFYQSNYAIGGTGSVLGVFRMDELLEEKPDLLFVEFAVNDENELSEKRRIQTMEGIVRKTWKVLPETDIIFVYTTAVKFMDPFLASGKRMEAVLDHEVVADHYAIPSVDMGIEVARLILIDTLLLSADPSRNAEKIVFFSEKDHYHPLQESGHPVYAGSIIRYLEKMKQEAVLFTSHELVSPIKEDNWENGQIVSPGKTKLSGSWIKIAEDKKDQFGPVPELYHAKTGATMEFSFRGSELGFYDCIGPGTGFIQVEVDGEKTEFKRFDVHCNRFRRNLFFLDKMDDEEHEVKITVTGNAFDKTSVMKEGQDPKMYAEYDWYPVGILVTGEIL